MKTKFKSNYKRNKAGRILNKALAGDGKPVERLAKAQEQAGDYQVRTDKAEGVIVASRKEKPWTYNGIDI